MDRIEVPIWTPQPGPQTWAFNSPARIIGYGGAAGGGKTDLILGMALTQHKRTLILRREGTQLKAVVDRSKEIIWNHPPSAKASFSSHPFPIWRNLPNGRMIQMGGIPNIGDEKKYQGQPHDFKAFDEATEIAQIQYRFVNGWNRSSDPRQVCKALLTFNPPTTNEGQWVIAYFGPWLDQQHPNPAKPCELRYFTTLDGKEVECDGPEPFYHRDKLVKPVSRTFIPAKLSDNAYYAGGDYEATLQALPEPLRSQMLEGDFQAGVKDDPWQVIPTSWVQRAQQRWKERSKPSLPLSAMGVDVARGGSDKTVISKRYGNWFAPLLKHAGSSTPSGPAVAGLVISELANEPNGNGGRGAQINVDVIGVGSSAYDSLKSQNIKGVNAINVAAGSDETDKSKRLSFVNLRAEIMWKLREALDPETGEDLALPDDSELLADLCSARWQLKSNGIQIENKEDIKKRLNRSPDCGDALALAFHQAKAGLTLYTLSDLEAQGF